MSNQIAPAVRMVAVNPSDSVPIPIDVQQLVFLGAAAGNVKITTAGGDVQTIPVQQFFKLEVQARLVWATGTTATGIYAMGH